MSTENMDNYAKHKEGKPPLQTLYPQFLERMAKIREMGDKKHADNNWKKGLRVSDLVGAILRHTEEINKGNMVDPESGFHHMAHIAVNAMFISFYQDNWDEYKACFDLPWGVSK